MALRHTAAPLMKSAIAFGIFMFVVLFVTAIEVTMRLWKKLLLIGLALAILALSIHYANAHDYGQWEATDPAIRHWYQTLMQPDNPAVSCCGEADAYWADSYEVSENGEYIAIITDDRPDEPLRRRLNHLSQNDRRLTCYASLLRRPALHCSAASR
jgi:hypothetical protein